MALDRTFHPGPSAYRKATRALHIAARLRLPVVTLVDTPGANPSEASENGGIAPAIAELFSSMLTVPVPVVSVVTGEGGSGGALAFATSDVLLAYDGSIFSVIAPEMAAEILWRDPARAPEAARLLRPTARELLRKGIAQEVIPEPLEAGSLGDRVAYHLALLSEVAADELVAARRRRWRSHGQQGQTGAPETTKGQA
jgi:acetyl-CoA carboxylase carboxyl transferase subunit beta